MNHKLQHQVFLLCVVLKCWFSEQSLMVVVQSQTHPCDRVGFLSPMARWEPEKKKKKKKKSDHDQWHCSRYLLVDDEEV